MGLNNKTTLKSQADLIRYEDGEGKNTAERVGKVISEIIEKRTSRLRPRQMRECRKTTPSSSL